MGSLIGFIRKEAVLFVSLILAFVSCFFISPDSTYLSYIDFKTLALLFCLMAIMAGLSKTGFFTCCADRLLLLAKTSRGIQAVLVLLCFFFSAFITNDVALITFVPFAITVLKRAKKDNLIPLTVILQTIAANMGSCLTPIGNPQNIYIFSISDISFGRFFMLLLPYSAVSLVFVMICLLGNKCDRLQTDDRPTTLPDTKKTVLYGLLFIVCILSVLKLVHFTVCLVASSLLLLFADRKVFLKVDYSLLLTFIAFFIFVGNMGRIPLLREQISFALEGREVLFSALISQIISNVPAALLLSGFSGNFEALAIGVNIGGLGTLIASMASLISYKYIAREMPDKKGKYFLWFTLLNFLLLIIMLLINLVI